MKGRKHHEEGCAERKHGGRLHHKHHKAHGGSVPEKADGNPEVIKEAESGKHLGKIGGVKGSKRLDRRHGGACRKHGGHAHPDGSAKVHHGHGGVAHHHSLAGGHKHHGHHGKHHASGGAATGADNSPYSSAGKGLRGHAHGGRMHHGHHGRHH
jgi:hypothetical protein